MKRFFKGCVGILPFLAALGIQYFIVIVFTLVYSVYLGFQIGLKQGMSGLSDSAALANEMTGAMNMELIYLISVFAIIVMGVVFFFWYRHEIRYEVRGKRKDLFTLRNVALFAVLGIGCQFLISGIMSLVQPLFSEVFEDYAKIMEELTSGNEVVVLLLVVLIAPVAEELVFRGMILHKTNKYLPFLGANIFQGVLFGIYHMNIIQGIYATFLGMLLGLTYRKFRTIYAPIMLHMLVNASSFILVLMPEGNITYVLLLVVGAIFVGFAFMRLKLNENPVFQAQGFEYSYVSDNVDPNMEQRYNFIKYFLRFYKT